MTRLRTNSRAYCCWCKRHLTDSTERCGTSATRDHLNPQAAGGGRWVPACFQCNQLKGDIAPDRWMWFIDHHPRYWRTFTTTQQVARVIVAEVFRRGALSAPPQSVA